MPRKPSAVSRNAPRKRPPHKAAICLVRMSFDEKSRLESLLGAPGRESIQELLYAQVRQLLQGHS